MELPYRKNTILPSKKISKYLLSLTHPIGKYKAIFFRKMGFDESNVELFEEVLLTIAQTNEVTKIVKTPYGKNYEIESMTVMPNGRQVLLRTIWFTKIKTRKPSFVTAYPV